MKYNQKKLGTYFYVYETEGIKEDEDSVIKRLHLCKCRYRWQALLVVDSLNETNYE